VALKHFDLHVPISEDGRTTFAEVADILDHLATLYAWHPDVHAHLLVGANGARVLDRTYDAEMDEGHFQSRLTPHPH
jgi:hypothetical protein